MTDSPIFSRCSGFLIHETAVHWIDTFRYLFGPPDGGLCRPAPGKSGDRRRGCGLILFDHPHGVRGVFDGNRSLDHAAENPRRTMGEGLFEGRKAPCACWATGRSFCAVSVRWMKTHCCPPTAAASLEATAPTGCSVT